MFRKSPTCACRLGRNPHLRAALHGSPSAAAGVGRHTHPPWQQRDTRHPPAAPREMWQQCAARCHASFRGVAAHRNRSAPSGMRRGYTRAWQQRIARHPPTAAGRRVNTAAPTAPSGCCPSWQPLCRCGHQQAHPLPGGPQSYAAGRLLHSLHLGAVPRHVTWALGLGDSVWPQRTAHHPQAAPGHAVGVQRRHGGLHAAPDRCVDGCQGAPRAQ